MEHKIVYLKEIDSTNTYAANLCRNEADLPRAVVAEFQTNGSGRMGRTFYSPENVGIYMTYILDTKNVETLNLITTCAGVAVAEVIEEICKIETEIKWPNDIIISSKKVCGILTKLITEKGKITFALIGIGVNVLNEEKDFPEDIKDIATSLRIETNKVFDKQKIIDKIIDNLNDIFINKKISEKEIVKKAKEKSNMLGKKVFVKSENKEFLAIDISSDGGLVVLDENEEKIIHSGEVELF